MSEYDVFNNSKKMKHILEVVDKISDFDTTVLITGESGTGKELLSRLIYTKSHRANKPFISINCAAIPENLIENELFGHKKGAFTDAVSDYAGKIGASDGGTLFLDEIGDIPLLVQTKLLRFIQFRTYEPIGSNETITSDVRIIAATNKNLQTLVQQNKFREDLYYRLNVIPIELPSLRERKHDILPLTVFFINKFNKQYNKSIDGLSNNARQILLDYDWLGNIRELENVIEKAVVLSKSNILDENSFIELKNNQECDHTLKYAVDNFKKQYITDALEKNAWHQTKTAKYLDIQRTYLSKLIKDLNIDKN